MHQDIKKKLRLTVSLLLVLSLLSVAASFEPYSTQCLQQNLKTALLSPDILQGVVGSVLLDLRTNIKSPDGCFKYALIFEQTSGGLAGASVSFLSESSGCFAQCAGRTRIIIRAPPCFKA